MTVKKRDGSRIIELYQPFDDGSGRMVSEIVLRPVTLEHSLRWQAGYFKSAMALFAELSGLTEAQLGMLQYPEAAAVLDEFFLHVPARLRESVAAAVSMAPLEAPAPATPSGDAPFNADDWVSAPPDPSILG